MWGAKLQETSAQSSPLSSPCLEGSPPARYPVSRGAGVSPELLACIWHQLNLPPDSGTTPLALEALVADWLLFGWRAMPIGHVGCGAGKWVAGCLGSDHKNKPPDPKPRVDGARRVGFGWLVAIKVCRCWQHSVTLHKGQGCSCHQPGTPLAIPSFPLKSLKCLSGLLSALFCLVLSLRMTPGTAAAAFPMLLFKI